MTECRKCGREGFGWDHVCDPEDIIAMIEERMSRKREREITMILNGGK